MRRRKLFTLAAGASAVLCIAVCVMWVRSTRIPDDLFLPILRSHRYSIRSERGHVTLFMPPPRSPVTATRAAEWRALCTEYHLECVAWRPQGDEILLDRVLPFLHSGRIVHVSAGPENATAADLSGPLPDALESDETFAVAHWVLTEKIDRRSRWDPIPIWPADWRGSRSAAGADSIVYNGLVMRFPPGRPARERKTDELGHLYFDRVMIDPAQRPAIRDYWHRRLRVPIRTIAYPSLVVATALLPFLWSGVRVRRMCLRRRRVRLGLCLRCGHDLRANSGRCSECGEPATARVADAA